MADTAINRTAELVFSHPKVNELTGPLRIRTKPNDIMWSYGLNTANYPTYGGEVVQILSVYIDDIAVSGNIGTYKEMENIYSWFLLYMQIATAGLHGEASYNPKPVQMVYVERGWHFAIYPKSLPSFKYGRDVVAPEWKMIAAVDEADPKLKDAITDEINNSPAEAFGEKQLFGAVTGNIGFSDSNPFSDPDAAKTDKKKKDAKQAIGKDNYGELADWFNNLIPSYLDNDFDSLAAEYSKPAFLAGKDKKSSDQQGNASQNSNR